MECSDVHCKDQDHLLALDMFTLNFLEKIQISAESCLPLSPNSPKKVRKKTRPGWNDEIRPFRDNAYFWHQIWSSCGRPLNNEVHKIMKKTRNLYHFQYRKCKRAEEKIKKDKLLSACLGEREDLFNQIKNLRKASPVIATSIDGHSDNIPEHFRSIYSKLYNSTDDAARLLEVNELTNQKVSQLNLRKIEGITPTLLKEAI